MDSIETGRCGIKEGQEGHKDREKRGDRQVDSKEERQMRKEVGNLFANSLETLLPNCCMSTPGSMVSRQCFQTFSTVEELSGKVFHV